jgi:uridylate kinase
MEISVLGVETVIVFGGGNIMRGGNRTTFNELEETTSHQIGILSSLISALAFRDLLRKSGQPAETVSPLNLEKIVPSYSADYVIDKLQEKKVVVIGGGTGRTHCSTDTAAAEFGIELKCDIILKATKVDGVYDSDPVINPDAKKYDQLGFDQAIEKELKIMDLKSFTLCKDSELPIRVFNVLKPGNLRKIVFGEDIGTLVS